MTLPKRLEALRFPGERSHTLESKTHGALDSNTTPKGLGSWIKQHPLLNTQQNRDRWVIGFMYGNVGTFEIQVVRSHNGGATEGPRSIGWSPDGTRLVYDWQA
jgi:hypothetical protein